MEIGLRSQHIHELLRRENYEANAKLTFISWETRQSTKSLLYVNFVLINYVYQGLSIKEKRIKMSN